MICVGVFFVGGLLMLINILGGHNVLFWIGLGIGVFSAVLFISSTWMCRRNHGRRDAGEAESVTYTEEEEE